MKKKQLKKVTIQLSAMRIHNVKKLELLCADNDNVNYINDTHYSPKATHLIVQYPDCSEKTLCFIASGKWILRQKYLLDSVHAGEWLNETHYHVHTKYPQSKLANASLKWKCLIEREQKWPFTNWCVLAILNDIKLQKALTNLIQAGHGEIRFIYTKEDLKKIDETCVNLVIYEQDSELIARYIWKRHKLPCYTFKCIPDYLMQGVYSRTPLFNSTLHSTNIMQSSLLINNINNNDKSMHHNSFFPFSNSYAKLGIYSKRRFRINNSSIIIDYEIACKIQHMWNNACYLEALDMIKLFETHENLPHDILSCLYKFIHNHNTHENQLFVESKEEKLSMNFVYNKVYAYLLEQLLNNPPQNHTMKQYYKKIFKEISIESFTIELKDASQMHELVDLLYLMSIHDYLLLNNSTCINLTEECSLVYCKINEEICIGIVNKLLNRKQETSSSSSSSLLYKMIQIISLMNKYFDDSNKVYKKFFNEINGQLKQHEQQQQQVGLLSTQSLKDLFQHL